MAKREGTSAELTADNLRNADLAADVEKLRDHPRMIPESIRHAILTVAARRLREPCEYDKHAPKD